MMPQFPTTSAPTESEDIQAVLKSESEVFSRDITELLVTLDNYIAEMDRSLVNMTVMQGRIEASDARTEVIIGETRAMLDEMKAARA